MLIISCHRGAFVDFFYKFVALGLRNEHDRSGAELDRSGAAGRAAGRDLRAPGPRGRAWHPELAHRYRRQRQ